MKTLLALLVLASLPLSLAASTVRVPLDQPDLPTAITAAADGDTILVAASHVTVGGLTIPGRPLTILGGWNDDFTGPAGKSPISAAGDDASLVIAAPTSGSPTVADFAIAPGAGRALSQPLAGRYGGGVLVLAGAPELRDLTIDGADIGSGSEVGCGGAVALIDSDATVSDAVLTQNRATWGGAVFVQGGAPTLSDLTITDSTCNPDGGGEEAQGAGVLVRASDATLIRCEIRGGRGAVRGGGLCWLGARGRELTLVDCAFIDNWMDQDGGGVYGEDGAITMTGGWLVENRPAPAATFASGGGAYLTGVRATITGLVVHDNAAAAGGGITVNEGPEVTVADCIFLANVADLFGAALNYQRNDAGEITGNTMAGNQNPTDAGVLHLVGCSPPLARNLVSFNGGGGIGGVNANPSASCNDVFGNGGAGWIDLDDPTGSDGNIALDPLFCDLEAGDPSLDAASPCLDAEGCGRIGAVGEGCGGETAVGDLPAVVSLSAFPNPANPAVTIRFTLAEAGPVRLVVHDVRGRLVRELIAGARGVGDHHVRFDGRDHAGRDLASGVYVYRLDAAGQVRCGRLTLLR